MSTDSDNTTGEPSPDAGGPGPAGEVVPPVPAQLPPTILVTMFGTLAILLFDAAAAFVSRFVPMPSTVLLTGTLAIMVATGYAAGILRQPLGGAVAGLAIGVVDVLVGSFVEMAAGPPSRAASFARLSPYEYALSVPGWGVVGLVLGLIGGLAGIVAVRLRPKVSPTPRP